MLDVIRNTQSRACSLGDFVDHVRANVDFRDQDAIRACSTQLGRLHLNRTFLIDYVLASLEAGLVGFENHNRYTPPSLVLAVGPDFMVRANLWRATDTYEKLDLNVYGLAHDHNFDFLTLNYSGPGYISKMYTYDYSKVTGVLGEVVELQDNGTLEMAEGEMFLYRKSIDVHEQFPPRSDSITINLMATLEQDGYPNQYIFDTRDGSITDILGGFHRQEHVFAMALALDDPECDDVMRRIARKSDCALTRSYLGSRLAGARRLQPQPA